MYKETIQSEELYGRVAKRYDIVFERAILSEGTLTQSAQQHMNGRRVLDLACGNGRWLERFAPGDYVGLDLNEQMLAEARVRYPMRQFIRADMTNIPFPDESFDGVMSMFGAMGHLPYEGQERMLREICRVLASDGVAIITNGNMWSPFVLPVTLAGNRVRLEGVRFKVYSTTPRLFRKMLRRFRILDLVSYDYSFIPMLPIEFTSCLLGRDYKRDYGRLMSVYNHCAMIPGLRWFGKQLVAVCQKR